MNAVGGGECRDFFGREPADPGRVVRGDGDRLAVGLHLEDGEEEGGAAGAVLAAGQVVGREKQRLFGLYAGFLEKFA